MKNSWLGLGFLVFVLCFFWRTVKDIKNGKIVTSKHRGEFTGKIILRSDNPAIFKRVIITRFAFQLIILVFSCFLIYSGLKK